MKLDQLSPTILTYMVTKGGGNAPGCSGTVREVLCTVNLWFNPEPHRGGLYRVHAPWSLPVMHLFYFQYLHVVWSHALPLATMTSNAKSHAPTRAPLTSQARVMHRLQTQGTNNAGHEVMHHLQPGARVA